QSSAGATATGTHGTGKDLGSLSTQVLAFESMSADGSSVICDAQTNPDSFQAQRIPLGSFGVATRIRINVSPASYSEERVEARPLGEMAERWQESAAATRHFEFFVFPYADTVIFKSLQPVAGEGVMPRSTDIDERPFRIACELSRKANFLIPSSHRRIMRSISQPSRRPAPPWQISPGARTIRF
ncbi:hypothetical protein OY671_009644, partial [Metschnikowia pulcherrima]